MPDAREHMTKEQKLILTLTKLAAERGVTVTDKGHGHIQLRGPHLLVNYYPFSAKRTAYVAGTKEGVPHCDLTKAVAMARNPPALVPKEKKDGRNYCPRELRMQMLNGRTEVKCRWCPTMIDLDTSTIEHIIPLGRGGLDHANNRTLACRPCNTKRANNMPELSHWPVPEAAKAPEIEPETTPPWETS